MKTNLFLVLLIMVYLSSCNQKEQVVTETQSQELQPSATRMSAYNANFQATLQRIVMMTYEVMNKSTSGSDTSQEYNTLPVCAKVHPNPKENSVKIDFSDGCMSPWGELGGLIKVNYSGAFGGTNTKIEIEFINFSATFLGFHGKIELSDFTYPSPTTIRYKIKATRLTVAYDGVYIVCSFDMLQNWQNYQTKEKDDDSFLSNLQGSFLYEGQTYVITTLVDLFSSSACSSMTPTSGKISIVADKTYQLDYGKGKCDNVAELTVDHKTVPILLRPF